MRYGIDLDGVCFDFLNPFRIHLNEKFGSDLEEEDITEYNWYKNTDKFDKDDFFREFHKFGKAGAYRNFEIIPGAIDALEKIVNAGHEIFYITNRPAYTKQDTVDIMEEHKLPHRENLFYANGDKAPIVNDLNIDVFVDDSSRILGNLVENTGVKIYCMHFTHNRDVEHERITRIKDWDDFLLAEAL